MMAYQPTEKMKKELDMVFRTLLNGLEENAGLEEKKELVKSVHPWFKKELLQRFLSGDEQISLKMRLNSLAIFHDRTTRFFHPSRIMEIELDLVFEFLLDGLDENAGLEEKKELVKSVHPWFKKKLLQRFLSDDERLNLKLRLNSLPILLDESTKSFNFVRFSTDQAAIKTILEILKCNCPNIERLDLTNLVITSENITNFKILLGNAKQLKSLRVGCWLKNQCAIYQILFQEDFNQHDQDVQNGLRKIQYINGAFLKAPQCAKLLILLPKLKSLGMHTELGQALNIYICNINDDNRLLLNITEFHDVNTNSRTFAFFVKCFPKTNRISLESPSINIIRHISKFKFLIDLTIYSEYVIEVIKLIQVIGKRIEKLDLRSNDHKYNPRILRRLCPKLVTLKVNDNY